VIGIDTNLLLYARLPGNVFHSKARTFLEEHLANPEVAIAEFVLVELYLALRNPTIVEPALSASEAKKECEYFRRHSHWQLVENAEIMDEVWPLVGRRDFPRRRIIDLRLGKTLLAYGVTEFATANEKDFQNVGFQRVWNPAAP